MELKISGLLITGGCGFIGTSLVSVVKSKFKNIPIRVVDNLSTGTREDLGEVRRFTEVRSDDIKDGPKDLELVVGDVRDRLLCEQICNGIDVVVHLAASTGVDISVKNPILDMEVNVVGTFNLLEAARKNSVKKFILSSSGASIGEVEPPIHEDIAPKPVSPYGASKLSGEAYCSAYYRTYGIKTASLRFGNVYGPRSKYKSSVIAKFLKQAFADQPLVIYGDGLQTRDFIYIDDLIKAILLAVNSNSGGEVFQIATHKETSVIEIADKVKLIVEKDTGKKVEIVYDSPRVGDVKRNYSDISKASRILGYTPEYELEEGLKNTYNYFKNISGSNTI